LARERQFFDTITKYGGKTLAQLTVIVSADYSVGRKKDFAFYNVVGGVKTQDKQWLLNKCLVICAIKWVVTKVTIHQDSNVELGTDSTRIASPQ
jgi:hypothetical protein